jgi:spore coat polysaccharide biosynthesis predicted glycosyltransferase SpsG
MTAPPRIGFVTHGGPAIGLGHLGRCLALAAAWAAEGAALSFMTGADEEGARRVERSRADLLRIGARVVDVDATAWEEHPVTAREHLRRLEADVIVVDSYAAAPEFLASLGGVTERVVAVDDLADRPLPVHVVVNGGVAAETLPYDRGADTLFLLGPRYALVHPRFAEAVDRSPRARVERVFVALGGGDGSAVLETVLAAADAALDGAEVHAVTGPFAAPTLGARRRRIRVVVHRDPADMRALMVDADLAVSGAGVTLYELAATGVPAVIVEMADNQAPNAAGFSGAGAALRAGAAQDPRLGEGVAAALGRLAGDAAVRAEMAGHARDLVDGAGALRVAREVTARAGAR